jgi:hypothetical membrane protein
MPWAKTGHTYVAYVLGLLVVVQFFLAGIGIFGGSIDAHKGIGSLFQLLALILVVLALLAGIRGPLLGMSIATFLFAALQSAWVQAIGDIPAVAALHVVGALAIAMTLREIVDRITAGERAPEA